MAAVGAVAVNALAWQTARHPSPLFAAKPGAGGQRPLRVQPAQAPVPPARPMAAMAPPVPAPSGPPAPALRPPRDPIGDLIRTSSVPTPPPRDPAAEARRDSIGDAIRASEAGAAKPEAQRLAASAQRALTKLGYGSLKVDGLIGAETRQAIESFERERKLPVTGELNPRTVRELSIRSGLPIE